ncbi:MAG TPA: hypothetical protein VJ783_05785 [Pirellulales bacterium]|nr:hypothetical protein [Pirellulales bacterium]
MSIRRLFQFKFKWLIVLVAALAMPLGWVGNKLHQKRQERVAIQQIRNYGVCDFCQNLEPRGPRWLWPIVGNDFFDDQDRFVLYYSKTFTDMPGNGPPFAEQGLAPLRYLPTLVSVDLHGCDVSDAGLVYLGELRRLRELDLSETPVSDAGLAHLRGLTSLRHLYLKNTRVSDAAVGELQKALPNCEVVRTRMDHG